MMDFSVFKDMVYSPMDTIGAFFVSAIVAYLLTPFAGFVASKVKLLDKPANTKAHVHATPLLGGVAIYVAFFLGVIFTTGFNKDLLSIFIGGTLLLLIGIIDDKTGMMPNIKLFGQLIAALTVAKMGIRVAFIDNYYLSVLFTCFWIIGMTNAFNLLDNLNGLSAGIAVIASFFFALLAWLRGDFMVAAFAIALCGSSLGFLKHNFPKASIFMGDAGSLFIGFVLACVAIIGSWETPTKITSIAVPILILGYPIFDTTLVTIARIREKRSIFQGGKDHSSHRLALLGLKKRRAVLVIYGITSFLGLCAFVLTKLNAFWALGLMSAAMLAMCILGMRLGMLKLDSKGKRPRRNNETDA